MSESIAQKNARLNKERDARIAAGGHYARSQQLAKESRAARSAKQK